MVTAYSDYAQVTVQSITVDSATASQSPSDEATVPVKLDSSKQISISTTGDAASAPFSQAADSA